TISTAPAGGAGEPCEEALAQLRSPTRGGLAQRKGIRDRLPVGAAVLHVLRGFGVAFIPGEDFLRRQRAAGILSGGEQWHDTTNDRRRIEENEQRDDLAILELVLAREKRVQFGSDHIASCRTRLAEAREAK